MAEVISQYDEAGNKRSARTMMELRDAAGIPHPSPEGAVHAAPEPVAAAPVAPPPVEAPAPVVAAPPAPVVTAPTAPVAEAAPLPVVAAAPVAPPAPTPEPAAPAVSHAPDPKANFAVPSHDPETGKKLSAREKIALREKMLAEGYNPVAAAPAAAAPAASTPVAEAAPVVHAAPPKPAAKPVPPFPAPAPVELSPAQETEATVFTNQFGEDILEKGLSGRDLRLTVKPSRVAEVAEFAKAKGYTFPVDIVATDLLGNNEIRVSYVLSRFPNVRENIVLHAVLPREDPRVPTVTHVYQGADWPEREAYDLVGVIFEGHEDLRRIMTPDDWDGHPLRKDYTFVD